MKFMDISILFARPQVCGDNFRLWRGLTSPFATLHPYRVTLCFEKLRLTSGCGAVVALNFFN